MRAKEHSQRVVPSYLRHTGFLAETYCDRNKLCKPFSINITGPDNWQISLPTIMVHPDSYVEIARCSIGPDYHVNSFEILAPPIYNAVNWSIARQQKDPKHPFTRLLEMALILPCPHLIGDTEAIFTKTKLIASVGRLMWGQDGRQYERPFDYAGLNGRELERLGFHLSLP